MANDPVFPPAVFVIIVDNLAHDLDTLRSCALVSWTFYGLARLFSHLQVGPRVDQEHSLAKLCGLLEESPSWAARVQSLRLCDGWEEGHPSWITEADLGRCFSLLESLTCLSLAVKGPCWPWRLAWSKISAANRHAIRAILPTLTRFELQDVNEFPLTLLSHCSSLRSLTLENVTFARNFLVPTAKVSRSHMWHLCLHVPVFFVHRFLDWITSPESPLDISCLFSLECTVHDLDIHLPIQRLLDASAPSLQHLCIDNYSFCLSSYLFPVRMVVDVLAYLHHKLDLHKLVHLHTLTLDIRLDIVEPRDRQRHLSLGLIFLPPLQKLALILNLESDNPRPKFLEALASADSALAALPSISSVRVILWHWIAQNPPHTRKEPLIDICDAFIQQMPLLADRLADTGGLHVLKCV
ncbi:hypothetical protein C8R45DRAFT_928300 [Mycena sanguinolenta]|nr:hypothetical protein C8R45DRAFT_928300 [Mycena sanguinolenta]